jgi:hypothetical protein
LFNCPCPFTTVGTSNFQEHSNEQIRSPRRGSLIVAWSERARPAFIPLYYFFTKSSANASQIGDDVRTGGRTATTNVNSSSSLHDIASIIIVRHRPHLTMQNTGISIIGECSYLQSK